MQPQSPYGPPQPYNSQGSPNPQGQPQPGQPYPPYPPQPGQAYSQQPTPGQAVNSGSASQPPMPVYAPPPGLQSAPSQPNDMPPPPPAATTPYDFFLDQPKPHAPSSPLAASGKRYGAAALGGQGINKFALIIGGAIVIAIILGIVALLLPKDTTSPQWFAIAQRQQEIIRVCTLGGKAKYQSTRNFAITCQTGVTSSQRELLAYMKKSNLGYNLKQINLLADAKTDAKLKTAASSSTYDDVFREIIQQQLTTYNRALTTQLGVTTTANGREVLTKNQRSAELLLKIVIDNSDKTVAPVETTN
jgi:hypothetical protein